MYARARPGPGEFTAASGSISAVATTASGAVAAAAADADAGSSGLLGAGASAAVLSKLSSSTIHGIRRRFGFLSGSSYVGIRREVRCPEGRRRLRTCGSCGGVGRGGRLFVGEVAACAATCAAASSCESASFSIILSRELLLNVDE